eukprot:CAMPEP_0178371580 /NCGR_PEP_ID=MMETSP0689_2-20121128/899_1 /TAXON_ID=160604 /ORGANISM="Amphidinium massartii, Strain CS-259" /LENGTH=43 /DNA_ID= /DNA_START= /DNA_END= /DNA_ORIENTATION=
MAVDGEEIPYASDIPERHGDGLGVFHNNDVTALIVPVLLWEVW